MMTISSTDASVPSVVIEQVTKQFPTAQGPLTVVDNVSFSLPRAATLAIIGPSGSGKSTLLGLMAGLDKPTHGHITIAGTLLNSLSLTEMAAFRGRTMGFIFQSFRLLPTLTARENVAVPLELAGQHDALAQADMWLEKVGLAARRFHMPSQLSGGEQQRVALARAMAPRPAVIFADEPTGNLDSRTGAAMTELLFSVAQQQAATLIIVTHDGQLAQRAQRIIRMHDGRAVDERAATAGSSAL
jgi:putative ABC transport system ATP-binding protein